MDGAVVPVRPLLRPQSQRNNSTLIRFHPSHKEGRYPYTINLFPRLKFQLDELPNKLAKAAVDHHARTAAGQNSENRKNKSQSAKEENGVDELDAFGGAATGGGGASSSSSRAATSSSSAPAAGLPSGAAGPGLFYTPGPEHTLRKCDNPSELLLHLAAEAGGEEALGGAALSALKRDLERKIKDEFANIPDIEFNLYQQALEKACTGRRDPPHLYCTPRFISE